MNYSFFTRLIALLGIAILIASCGTKTTSEDLKIFRYNIPENIDTLEPSYTFSSYKNWINAHVFSSLVALDTNLDIQPCIAKSWEISNDGKTYTFHLRQDIYFHDSPIFENGKGRIVTAHDFVYGLKNIINSPENPSSYIVTNIANDESSVSAPDDFTLVIQLRFPYSPFLSMMALTQTAPIPVEHKDALANGVSFLPVGTGPFYIKHWKKGDKLTLLKFPKYFEKDIQGNSLPYIDGIVINFEQDPHLALASFLKGELDGITGTGIGIKESLINNDGKILTEFGDSIRMVSTPQLRTDFLGINQSILPDNHPLKNNQIRRALNLALDRNSMIQFLHSHTSRPATNSFTPLEMMGKGYTLPEKGYYFNLEEAKSLIESAYNQNPDLRNEKIVLSYFPAQEDFCVYLKNTWKDLDINFELEELPPSRFGELFFSGKLPFFWIGFAADYYDPISLFASFYGPNKAPSGPNYFGYQNLTYDSLFERALEATSENLRQDLFSKLNAHLINNNLLVLIEYNFELHFFRNTITNIETNPFSHFNLKKSKLVSNKEK